MWCTILCTVVLYVTVIYDRYVMIPRYYCEFLFFFFKQKTAYEMRISDWSSDVCSSDLVNINEIREAIVNWLESVELRATRSQSSINCHKDLPCCENVRVNLGSEPNQSIR